jgi:ABC-type antimicrobial peptide transport system permease subunit
MFVRLLPWEYGVRNLFRRPGRSLLTLSALALVVLLVLVVVGFIRGLESSLAVSGDPRVVLVHSPGGSENLEQSALPARTGPVLAAGVAAVLRRYGNPYTSPEIYLGTRVRTGSREAPTLGLVRGVSPSVLLVRRAVGLTEGQWPGAGEVLAGRLAHAKVGRPEEDLGVGKRIDFEGQTWRISGRFAAGGSALEAELWCPLESLQQATRRQDYSLVALTLAPGASYADVDEFCKERLDLEIQATAETDYYASLRKHYRPVRYLSWLVVLLVAFAGVLAGMNAMYGAVVGRVRELATLQAVGFSRRAVALSLVQEATLLAAAASLIGAASGKALIDGLPVRFTMGAFALRIDGPALLWGCLAGLLLGVLGAIPPAVQAMRLPVAVGLKKVA